MKQQRGGDQAEIEGPVQRDRRVQPLAPGRQSKDDPQHERLREFEPGGLQRAIVAHGPERADLDTAILPRFPG